MTHYYVYEIYDDYVSPSEETRRTETGQQWQEETDPVQSLQGLLWRQQSHERTVHGEEQTWQRRRRRLPECPQ